MIQPQLIAFSMHQPPRPVLLDVQSIVSDEILVLDTFFIVLLHHGSAIAQWVQAGYADLPEHSSFRHGPLSSPLQQACACLYCTLSSGVISRLPGKAEGVLHNLRVVHIC